MERLPTARAWDAIRRGEGTMGPHALDPKESHGPLAFPWAPMPWAHDIASGSHMMLLCVHACMCV